MASINFSIIELNFYGEIKFKSPACILVRSHLFSSCPFKRLVTLTGATFASPGQKVLAYAGAVISILDWLGWS